MPSIWRTIFKTRDDAAQQAQAVRVAYRAVFASPMGQEVLADLLRRTGVARATFVAGDPGVSAFNEGQRRVGLYVLEMVNSDPDAAARMLQRGDTEAIFAEPEQEA
jgi:hypothetical protein